MSYGVIIVNGLAKNVKMTWNYVKKEKKSVAVYILMQIFAIIISVVIPVLSAKMIVELTNNALDQIIFIGLIIFLIENMRNINRYFATKAAQKIYRETLIRLQYDLSANMLVLDNKTIDKNGSGVFIQRLTNDTYRLSDIFSIITGNLANIISKIGIFAAVFIINKIAFAFLVVEVTILYIIEHARTQKYIQKDKEYRVLSEKVTGLISEMVRGVRDVKMLNCEKSFLSTMKERIYKQNEKKYEQSECDRRYRLLRGATRDLSDFLLLVLLVYMIKNSTLSVAAALIIHNYSNQIPSIINSIGDLIEKIKMFNLSATRISEIIDSEEFTKESFGAKRLKHINGDFEFKNVKFKYGENEHEVLKNLSFKVNANETVAFVGKSGAGKTTIFSLLCKMYKPDSGTITIDGIDIDELDKDSIRGNITIISQNPYIFNMSIKENLQIVKKDVTMKEIKRACHLACLDEFIASLPMGYDTVVGEGGITLSGGQRQRLAIARALVQKTEIILFDEATSALDNETQAKIQEAISNMKGEYTILIIAHRLSTIINADRIMLVDGGKIKAVGTHEELLKTNKSYKKLYEQELKKTS